MGMTKIPQEWKTSFGGCRCDGNKCRGTGLRRGWKNCGW